MYDTMRLFSQQQFQHLPSGESRIILLSSLKIMDTDIKEEVISIAAHVKCQIIQKMIKNTA